MIASEVPDIVELLLLWVPLDVLVGRLERPQVPHGLISIA